jgi:hypothetical protein
MWTRVMTESMLGRMDEVVDILLPSGVSAISGDTFNGYAAVRSLTIQPGCREMGDGGYEELIEGTLALCTSLVRVTIPGTCTKIGKCAFWGCAKLLQVTIPSSVTHIAECAFCGCSGLTQVTLPSSVRCIGDSAFQDCTALTHMVMPSGVTTIADQLFCGCSGLRRITIHARVTSIGRWAFDGCCSLTQLAIPSSVSSIGEFAFCGCSGMTRLTIPADMAEIGGWHHEVFKGVATLTRVTLTGCPLNPAVVEAVLPAIAPGGEVVGAELAGEKFGRLIWITAAP